MKTKARTLLCARAAALVACVCGWAGLGAAPEDLILLPARQRVAVATNASQHRIVEVPLRWDPRQTAAVVCDMWDRHWCRGATARVAEMAPRMDQLLDSLRRRGALIIHCPSETLKFYEGTPQRALARNAPRHEPLVPLQKWCGRDPQREPALPIDDADGGCDDEPRCAQGQPWTRQISTLQIREGDAVSDSAEVLNLMAERGIRNVLVMGVHLNMCVLGRPFGIRQLVGQGLNVVLVRDLTDTMYNSRSRPRMSHFTGTDLMVAHVESHWCPSVTSADLLGGQPFRFSGDQRKRALLLVGEDEYATWDTLPRFAADDLLPWGLAVTVLNELASDPGVFPGLERELPAADVVLVSIRRRALPLSQLSALRGYVESGRGLVGIRTASHAFALREGNPPAGRGVWPEFDADVLGGNYQGHHGGTLRTSVGLADNAGGHALLAGVDVAALEGAGTLYRTSPLRAGAEVLLRGSIPGQPSEPVCWVREAQAGRGRVVYTSLGHPGDFAQPAFRQLLANAVRWAGMAR